MAGSRVPNKILKCILCGDDFRPNSARQRCCNKIKLIPCEFCGEPMEVVCSTAVDKKTCSTACANGLIKRNREASAAQLTKKCQWCGEEFTPKSVRDVYCQRVHYKTCEVCGTLFEIDVRNHAECRSCSPECKKVLQVKGRDFGAEHAAQVATFRAKYGVDNAMQIPGVLDKMRATNRERHGADWYTQTEEYKQRVAVTSEAKYGVQHPLSAPEVIAKREATCMEKYGVPNVSQTAEVKQKIKATWEDKYHLLNVSQRHIPDMALWQSFQADPRGFILSKYAGKPTISQLSRDLGVGLCSIYNNINIKENGDLIKHCNSVMEEAVAAYLHEIAPQLKVVYHDRTVIYPYEIDIYLPELKIGIECNPTATHNSSLKDPWSGKPKSASYHMDKTAMCEDAGVRLIHIFGYEWEHKRAIIQSMLKNALGVNSRRIYARNCEVRDVTPAAAADFLAQNHRQGYAQSSVRIGLFYNEELVSLMTFGAPRVKSSKNYEWELIRFCSLCDITVVGAASKLFKHFVKHHNPNNILSYSDRAHTSGKVYPAIGFNKVGLSQPGYVWVDTVTDVAYTRNATQKDKLPDFFAGQDIDLSMTESAIMESHGYVKVYNSGNIVWEWVADPKLNL